MRGWPGREACSPALPQRTPEPSRVDCRDPHIWEPGRGSTAGCRHPEASWRWQWHPGNTKPVCSHMSGPGTLWGRGFPTSSYMAGSAEGVQSSRTMVASFSCMAETGMGEGRGRVLGPLCGLRAPTPRRAAMEDSAYGRIKLVLRWYLSGFYKKPKVRGGQGGHCSQGSVLSPHARALHESIPTSRPHSFEGLWSSPSWSQFLRDGAQDSDLPWSDPLDCLSQARKGHPCSLKDQAGPFPYPKEATSCCVRDAPLC